ncbi:hypothetical protein CERZMDRAFT_24850, partial [Cercospora zeae-maydis SCOH1-5]
IGNGMDGFVIRDGSHVLKIPQLYGRVLSNGSIEAHCDNYLYVGQLEIEKQAYRRLHGVPGVAHCIECSDNGILLEYYQNGALSEYIASHEPLPIPWRWYWAVQATEIIARCHDRGVLVFDIALRNFLLADDFSLRIIDFANSSLAPEGEDINHVNVDGYTARIDLLHLSNFIHSIMTWQKFSVDCAAESEWPPASQMPDIKESEYGEIVHKCWGQQYTSIQELLSDIQLCAKISSAGSL